MVKRIHSILVVDDNPADAKIAARILQRSGRYQHVLTAQSGAELIDMFAHYERSRRLYGDAFPPALILLDVNMPSLSGLECMNRLSQLETPEPLPPVLMLTGSDYPSDREQATSFEQVKGYLVKPLSRVSAQEVADSYGN